MPAGSPSRWTTTTVLPSASSRCTSSWRSPGSRLRGLPTAMVVAPTVPVRPVPARSCTSTATGGSVVAARSAASTRSVAPSAPGVPASRRRAPAVMAAAKGCVECRSRAAAQSRTSSAVTPRSRMGFDAMAAVTVGSLRVRVPVLSMATRPIAPSRSNAAPDFTTTPKRLAAPMAEITVTGTEMASAHGEAATSTTRARVIHSTGSPSREPMIATTAASTSTPGTNGRAMRSAMRARSPFSAWASSTRRTTAVRELSSPGAVAVTVIGAPTAMTPAMISSPAATSTGIDSPVTDEESTVAWASSSKESVGTRPPAGTANRMPGRISRAGMVRREPQSGSITVAVSGMRESSERRPRRARSIALSSRASEMEYRNARAAASATYPRRTAPMALMVMSRPMPRRRCRNRPVSAPGTNVDAPSSSASQYSAGEATPAAESGSVHAPPSVADEADSAASGAARPIRNAATSATPENTGTRTSRSHHQGVGGASGSEKSVGSGATCEQPQAEVIGRSPRLRVRPRARARTRGRRRRRRWCSRRSSPPPGRTGRGRGRRRRRRA